MREMISTLLLALSLVLSLVACGGSAPRLSRISTWRTSALTSRKTTSGLS